MRDIHNSNISHFPATLRHPVAWTRKVGGSIPGEATTRYAQLLGP